MINLKKSADCCGCAACVSACVKNAILMDVDSEGFLYPVVNEKICIDCGICDSMCIFNKHLLENDNKSNAAICAYAAKHISETVLSNSSSGGMFTALSDAIFSEGGIIYGAAFDNDFAVKHMRAETAQQRSRMRGSKYVQSDTRDVFAEVKKDLLQGCKVLFTGTPCQVDSLKSFLKNQTSGLYCCDLVCYGTPSPLMWKEHVNFICKKNHSELLQYFFRPKDWGWYGKNDLAIFRSGKRFHSTCYSNLFRNLYYSGLILRPSCHQCPYTNLNRPSDITIGDCHGIDSVDPQFGSNEGASLVLVNTSKGEKLFEKAKHDLKFERIDIFKVLQEPLQHPSIPNVDRQKFWTVYKQTGYKKAVNACFGRLYNVKYTGRKILNHLRGENK